MQGRCDKAPIGCLPCESGIYRGGDVSESKDDTGVCRVHAGPFSSANGPSEEATVPRATGREAPAQGGGSAFPHSDCGCGAEARVCAQAACAPTVTVSLVPRWVSFLKM